MGTASRSVEVASSSICMVGTIPTVLAPRSALMAVSGSEHVPGGPNGEVVAVVDDEADPDGPYPSSVGCWTGSCGRPERRVPMDRSGMDVTS